VPSNSFPIGLNLRAPVLWCPPGSVFHKLIYGPEGLSHGFGEQKHASVTTTWASPPNLRSRLQRSDSLSGVAAQMGGLCCYTTQMGGLAVTPHIQIKMRVGT